MTTQTTPQDQVSQEKPVLSFDRMSRANGGSTGRCFAQIRLCAPCLDELPGLDYAAMPTATRDKLQELVGLLNTVLGAIKIPRGFRLQQGSEASSFALSLHSQVPRLPFMSAARGYPREAVNAQTEYFNLRLRLVTELGADRIKDVVLGVMDKSGYLLICDQL